MTRPIDELLRQTGVPLFDADDATLSGEEVAIARIASALREDGTDSTVNSNVSLLQRWKRPHRIPKKLKHSFSIN